MSNDTKYDGWNNYETWAVKLWLDNEQGSYNEMTGEATRRVEEARDLEEEPDVSDFADYIKQQHEEAMPEVEGVFSDLLNAAMSEVDWYEIAEAYLSDAKEEAAQ